MKFLLDENVPRDLLRFLRQNKFECKTLNELHKLGITNGEVVKMAIETHYVIITCDSDYLNLKKSVQNQIRVIYIKLHPRDPVKLVELFSKNLELCLNYLNETGKVIITESDCVFKKPFEKWEI